jgi:uncharacterized protein YkwD
MALGLVGAVPAFAADGPLLAPPDTCPAESSIDASPETIEMALGCLINHARRAAGVPAVPRAARLSRSAQMKVDLIVQCDEFSHSPCGRPWSEVFRQTGYRGWAREILSVGTVEMGTARSAMEMWLASPGHRSALLNPEWTMFGVGVRTAVTLEGEEGTTLMAAHFGRPPSRPSERQPGDGIRKQPALR